jgi:hypothetical protein
MTGMCRCQKSHVQHVRNECMSLSMDGNMSSFKNVNFSMYGLCRSQQIQFQHVWNV